MRLINRLVPFPLESLESLLERLRQVNYYEEATWFHGFLPHPHKQRPNLLRSAVHYEALANLTGLSIDVLKGLTLHRFVTNFYLPKAASHLPVEYGDLDIPMWEPHGLAWYVHGRRNWKLCPLCWKEQHAVLLPWSLRHVTSCIVHSVLLVDRCSECSKRLHFDMASGRCLHCGKDGSTFPTISISSHMESMLLTRLVWYQLLCDPYRFPLDFPALKITHPLRLMVAPDFFEFLWRCGQLLAARDPHNPVFDSSHVLPDTAWTAPPTDLGRADIAATHRVLVAILKLLLGWPDAWYTMLERIAEVEASESFRPAHFPLYLAEQFGGPGWAWLHCSWINFMYQSMGQSDKVYHWIRYLLHFEKYFKWDLGELDPGRQFNLYFVEEYLPEHSYEVEAEITQQSTTSTRSLPLTQRAAARQLHIGERSLKRYIDSGTLRTLPQPNEASQRRWRLVEAGSLAEIALKLQQERISRLTLAQAAVYCGISEEQVVALVADGLLRAEHGPSLDGAPTWSFTEVALQDSLVSLLGHLAVQPLPSEHALSLTQALRIISGVGECLSSLLVAIQQGLLSAFRDQDAAKINTLRFEPSDLLVYLETQRRSKKQVLFTAEEVCMYLHCKPPVLERWCRTGLLVPRRVETTTTGTHKWYAIQDATTFKERYVTTDMAAELLKCTVLTVQRWAKAGRLSAVTGPDIDGGHEYRFDKEKLLQWRNERVPVGEAANLLGVSVATIDRWAKEGKMEPLQDMGGKQRWFSRQALLALRETG